MMSDIVIGRGNVKNINNTSDLSLNIFRYYELRIMLSAVYMVYFIYFI